MSRKTLLVSCGALLGISLLVAQQTKSGPFYVPAAWHPHEGGILKYAVDIRFG